MQLCYSKRRMEGLWMLNASVDRGHRAQKLLSENLTPLITRTPKENWKIHEGWVQRYLFYLFISCMYNMSINETESLTMLIYLYAG